MGPASHPKRQTDIRTTSSERRVSLVRSKTCLLPPAAHLLALARRAEENERRRPRLRLTKRSSFVPSFDPPSFLPSFLTLCQYITCRAGAFARKGSRSGRQYKYRSLSSWPRVVRECALQPRGQPRSKLPKTNIHLSRRINCVSFLTLSLTPPIPPCRPEEPSLSPTSGVVSLAWPSPPPPPPPPAPPPPRSPAEDRPSGLPGSPSDRSSPFLGD